METAEQGEKDAPVGEKKPRSKWDMFMNFLAYGGFLVIAVAVIVIAILISYICHLFK